MIYIKTEDGKISAHEGHVWTGLTDADGRMIFEGDRVHVFNYMHDQWVDGTVVWAPKNGEPSSFIVKLDVPFKETHGFGEKLSMDVDTYYLEGGPSCHIIASKGESHG